MTLDEAKRLANNGDLDAIMSLGKYYFGEDENRDINEALKWYETGAKFGYPICMKLASILYTINAQAIRNIVGSEEGIKTVFQKLDSALYWGNKARESGISDVREQIHKIIGEKGIAYYLYALGGEYSNKPTKEQSIERFENAIMHFKSIYIQTKNPEVYLYFAFTLHDYRELTGFTNENSVLEYNLLHKCVDEYFGEVIHSDIASSYLGINYIYGIGCNVDYDRAYYYLLKAHNAGFDTSELLCRFRKKLFGGYTFIW